MYRLDRIGFAYGEKRVLENLSLTFEDGCFYGVIGPNGCGKTTLIDLLGGHLKPDQGAIQMNGSSMTDHSPKELSRIISLVPQDFFINFPYTCKEIVMMGRYPHIPRFARPNGNDLSIVESVIKKTGLAGFVNRFVNQLSGGERQRVVFARSLAQDTSVLLLDEATSNLDMQHTISMLNLAAARVAQGALVISVMQDINLAAMYCDRMICMRNGGVYASGKLEEVLTAKMLREVFHVQAKVEHNPFSGALQVAYQKEVDR